ncbi:hypothetical protein [Ferrimonas senticii]|uniref:hypothetical protein n=1 Tax=Ferrimonas senticii TaxID=394566 RepID=UPI0003FBB36F|nr:hypothetical protein [Ferrimonas senticii]
MTEQHHPRPLQKLGARLWLGAKFGLLLGLAMLTLLTIYELLTAPTGVYLADGKVQWRTLGEFLLSWAPLVLGINVVMGALHYCRAAHDKTEDE